MTALVGSAQIPASQGLQFLFGVVLVLVGVVLLVRRRDLYWAYQRVNRYPDHGFVHFIVQFVAPVVLIVCGLGLIAAFALS